MKERNMWFIGCFCLGFSLTGIFGFLDGTILAIGIICIIKSLKNNNNNLLIIN